MHKLIGLALIKEYILENSPILVGVFTACEIPVSSLFPGVTRNLYVFTSKTEP
jgi:hypothetical protein